MDAGRQGALPPATVPVEAAVKDAAIWALVALGLSFPLLAFKTAQEDGTLQVEYLGIKKVPEAGDRPCFTLRRILKKAEPDGVKEVMLHIDTQTWQQVGNVLKDEQGVLVGAYYFRDFKFNPDLRKEDFQRQALTP